MYLHLVASICLCLLQSLKYIAFSDYFCSVKNLGVLVFSVTCVVEVNLMFVLLRVFVKKTKPLVKKKNKLCNTTVGSFMVIEVYMCKK